MQTQPKANSIITSKYDEARNVLVFTVLGQGDVELDLNKVSAANLARAAIHGMNQRIPDAAAIGMTDKDGEIIPKDERTRIKYERMNDLCRFYESGTEEWGRKRAEGEGSGKSLTIEAIARVKGLTYEEAEALVQRHADTVLKGDRKKALAQLRQAQKVVEAMAAIRSERDAKRATVDADSILDGLGEAPESDEPEAE